LSTCCSVPSMVGGTCNHVKQRAQYELVIALCFTAPSARRMKQLITKTVNNLTDWAMDNEAAEVNRTEVTP
jgi:hypothetical protein